MRSSATLPVRIGVLSWRLPVRAGVVTVLALGLVLGLMVLDVGLGEVSIAPADVVATVLGGGEQSHRFVVMVLRLPQACVAALAGAALGLSGALTQTFARNPLASPDILGVTQGAALGAVAVIVLAGLGGRAGGLASGVLQTLGLPLAAFVGAVLTASLLYLLSWRGGVDGGRLVLVGIGVGATLAALTSWLLVRARLSDAASATVWLNGSLASRGWEQGLPVLAVLVVVVPAALVLIPTLNASQLGEDSARGLGVRLQSSQLVLLVLAVALASTAVSAVGPLAFVAFVVPQVAVRLTGGARPPLLASMVLGSALVVGADLITRVVLPFSLPAGVVTAALGAPYLIWVLLRANRKVSG